MRTRRALPADAPTMARTIALGFDTYRAFAPIGWPAPPDETAGIRHRLSTPGAWALLAEIAGEPAGHVALLPRHGDESRTALLWQLFVRPAWWGSGLAGALHEAFERDARERGYARAALRTPAAHTRARRFYARRGWRVDGPPEWMPELQLALVTMRRAL